MGLRQFKTNFENIGKQEFLRSSVVYRLFFDIENAEVYPTKKQVKLKHILSEIPSTKVKKGELDKIEILIDIGNIERRYNNLINLEEVDKVGSDKNILHLGDIVIPKMQPQMGNIFLNQKHDRYVASTELLEYEISKEHHPVFIYYLITSIPFLSSLAKLESGKTHRRVNAVDLLRIKIPLIKKSEQEKIVSKIEPIEQKIKNLKSQIKAPQEVINRVFIREFGFNLERFEELKTVKIFNSVFSDYGNNKDLRNSVKFHRQAGQFVLEELAKTTCKKIKDFISEPIVLGKGISPSQYDDKGEYYYLSMATIKNWKFEKGNARLVTDKFATDNKNKTVKKNDILLARSGEGTIGKVAIIDDEKLNGVFADFTMRIRLKDYNQLFAYYYFRTEYFQYLVEINKKGLGNNTNIFPSQIQEFSLIDIAPEEQQRIVNEIKTELDAQEKIKTEIEAGRNKIDVIIKNAIKNS